jgi:uncharacterized membrane protein
MNRWSVVGFVLLVLGLGVFFGPLILSAVAIGRASEAKRRVADFQKRLDALSERVAQARPRHVPETLPQIATLTPLRAPAVSVAVPTPPALAAEGAEEEFENAVVPIERVEERVEPEPEPQHMPARAPAPPPIEPFRTAPEEPQVEQPLPVPSPMPVVVPSAPVSSVAFRARRLEEKVTANWLVWIGGIAVALAGLFLVRYASEQGWLSPALRCVAGVLFGTGLVAAGEAIRRRPLERAIASIKPDYVPQALTAAGFFMAFASVYLAYAFYDLMSSTLTFVLLTSVAMAAFALSLLEGPFVAVLGLVGAMATPALVSTDNPTAWGFFTYLAVIAIAALAIVDRRRWWWLALTTILATFAWTVVWTDRAFTTPDIAPMSLVGGIEALATLALWRRMRQRNQTNETDWLGLNAAMITWAGLAAAVATVFLVAFRSELAPPAHWAVLATAIGAVAVARLEPRFDLVLPVVCALVLVAFGLNYVDSIALDNLAGRALGRPAATLYAEGRLSSFNLHASVIGFALFAGGIIALASASRRDLVALATAAVPVGLLMMGYAEFRHMTGDHVWAFPAMVLLGAAAFAAGAMRRSKRSHGFPENVYVTTAVVAAVLAATFLFDRVWLTLAYSVLLIGMGAVSLRFDSSALRQLASLLATLVVARLTVNPDLRGYEFFHPFGMQWVIYGYLVPLACFVVASRLFRRTCDDLTVTVLEGGSLLFAILFVSIEIRIAMTGTIYSGAYKLPEMSLQTIAWLTSALILSVRHAKHPRPFSLWGARLLTLAGLLQAFVLQLVVYNPVFSGETIEGHGLLNMLILSLLAPAVLLWSIGSYFGPIAPLVFIRKFDWVVLLRTIAMLLAFAFVTEEVRVAFQGMVITPKHASLLELYVTTLFWLAPAMLPFAVGRLGQFKAVQVAALGLLLVSITMVAVGHGGVFNPAVTGEEIRGWPVLNTLLLGFFLPATLLAWLSRRVDEHLCRFLVGAGYFMLFVGFWLLVKQGFEGARLGLMHTSLLELYTTTLIWLGLATLPLVSRRVAALEGANEASMAVLAVSVMMLFGGHAVLFNPVVDGSIVRGWPVFNTLFLGFIMPSAGLVMLARSMDGMLRRCLAAAAYLLLFIGITLLVKQAFQGAHLVLETLSERESYAYSAAWLALALLTMAFGIARDRAEVRYAALTVLVLAVVKVFVFDMSGLGGLWRVASFLGLGLSLIGIGWIYQHFVYRQRAKLGMGSAAG